MVTGIVGARKGDRLLYSLPPRIFRSVVPVKSSLSPFSPFVRKIKKQDLTLRLSLLGDEDFVQRFRDVARGAEFQAEIPRCQRLLDRPSLVQLLPESVRLNKKLRNDIVVEAVEVHGHTQRAVADHFGLHYSTVNRILTKMADKNQE